MNSISDNLSSEFSILKKYSDNIIQLFEEGQRSFRRSVSKRKYGRHERYRFTFFLR